MADVQRRKISELRVVDLRHELEKRGLDKAGIKGVLVERLVKTLAAEGKNTEYLDNPVGSDLNISSGDTQDSSNEDRSTLGEKETKNDESLDDANVSVSNGAPDGDSAGNGTEVKTDGDDEMEQQDPDEDLKDPETEPKSNDQVDAEGEDLDEQDEDVVDENDQDVLDHGEDIQGESGFPDQKEEVSDSEDRALDDDSQGAIGSEDLDGPTEAPDDLSNDGSQNSDVPNEKAEVIDETGTKDSTSENNDKDNTNVAKDIACDDEADQDALRLTIGEEEEEDKNYILADEREKDKSDLEPEKHHDQQAEKSKTSKTTSSKSKPSPKSKGSSKSSAGSKDESNKASVSKEDNSKPDVSSRSIKSSGGSDANSGDKDASTDAVGQKKDKDSEKKVSKNDAKEGTTGSQKNDSQRERSRPVRRHDRTRMPVDNRPVRRPGSPRRASASNHRQTLSFEHIREMRERERQREREREMHRRMRERERREREEIARQREIERRNAEQLELLERERQRLRIEREKVEREKEELIRMERERQRAERERIEREKEEIRRAKLDERSRRGHKRPFEDDRKDPSPRDYGERKRIVVENRRPERAGFPEPERAIRTTATSSSTRERDRERLHRRRSKSRSPSPARHHSAHRRELGRSVGRSVPYPDREPGAQDWRYEESRRDVHYRAKETHKPYPEVPKEKRVEERREMRIARDRETVIPSTVTMRGAVPDYGSRMDSGLSSHRNAVQVTSKVRPDRYESVKNDPYALGKDDSWSRRANYGSSTVSPASFPSSMSSRDSWLDRKSDYASSERLAIRPSISDAPDRWISGSGTALGSTRSAMTSDHMPQVPPPPTFSHPSGPVSGSGSGSVRMYQSDPYSAGTYASKSRFPTQRY